MRRPFASLTDASQPLPWLGVNFWSRAGALRMWPGYDPATVERELLVLADHGLTVTRSFFFWPDFMPTPDTIDETLLDRFADFLDRHVAIGMRTIPTLIVGHMSGENWDPTWRGGRDLYTDVWLVGRQAWFAERVARRFAGHPAVAGWLVSNEMPVYGGPGTVEAVTAWAQLLVQALRAGGAAQPVSIGDGAWTVETTGLESGYRLRELAPLVDWIGPHVYPMGDDQVRQHLRAGFVCELATGFGRPVVLEEFGASSDFVCDEALGTYYRQVLHNALLGGATGWLAWNNTDFDNLADTRPYSHHPFEMHFGVTDVGGTPKPSLRELADFAAVVTAVEVHRCERAPSEVGIVIPAHVDAGFPFTDRADQVVALAAVEQASVAAREAGIPAVLIRERLTGEGTGTDAGTDPGIDAGCRLYLVPSAKQLTAPGWRRLEELARGGATVYVSYSPGASPMQRGPWYTGLNRIFGVRHRLRYGLADPVIGDAVTLTCHTPLGDLAAGDTLTFAVGGDANLRAYLPFEVVDAELVATDAAGRPALVRRRLGTGSLVLCAYPVEAMAAATPAVNPEQTWRLYAALARAAGVEPPVRTGRPDVLGDRLDRDDGTGFVWLVSQSDGPVTVTPRVATGESLADLHTGVPVGTVTLQPFGVRVLRTV